MDLNLPPVSRRVVGYASTNESHWDLGRASYVGLKAHCETRFHPVDIVCEGIHPEQPLRPVWQKLLALIKANEVTLVILPTLFHAAGANIALLSDFLALLENHQVKLISLHDHIDSDKFSRSQILLHFVTRHLSFHSTKGFL